MRLSAAALREAAAIREGQDLTNAAPYVKPRIVRDTARSDVRRQSGAASCDPAEV